MERISVDRDQFKADRDHAEGKLQVKSESLKRKESENLEMKEKVQESIFFRWYICEVQKKISKVIINSITLNSMLRKFIVSLAKDSDWVNKSSKYSEPVVVKIQKMQYNNLWLQRVTSKINSDIIHFISIFVPLFLSPLILSPLNLCHRGEENE